MVGRDREQAVERGERRLGLVEAQQRDGPPIDDLAIVRRERERRVVARERIRVSLQGVLGETEVGQRVRRTRIVPDGGGEEAQRLGVAAAFVMEAAGEVQDVDIAGIARQHRAVEPVGCDEVAVAMRRARLVDQAGEVGPRARGRGLEVRSDHAARPCAPVTRDCGAWRIIVLLNHDSGAPESGGGCRTT